MINVVPWTIYPGDFKPRVFGIITSLIYTVLILARLLILISLMSSLAQAIAKQWGLCTLAALWLHAHKAVQNGISCIYRKNNDILLILHQITICLGNRDKLQRLLNTSLQTITQTLFSVVLYTLSSIHTSLTSLLKNNITLPWLNPPERLQYRLFTQTLKHSMCCTLSTVSLWSQLRT